MLNIFLQKPNASKPLSTQPSVASNQIPT